MRHANFLYSIRWRIAIPHIILIIFVMMGLGQYLTHYLRLVQLTTLERESISKIHLLADFISKDDVFFEKSNVDLTAKDWSEILAARVTLISSNGTVIGESHTERTNMDNHLDRIEIKEAMESGIGTSVRYSQTLRTEMMYVAAPVIINNEITGFVRISVPVNVVETSINHLLRTIIIVTIIATFLSILVAVIIANITSRPIREITESARKLSMENLGGTQIRTSYDEVNQLSRTLTVMAEQLRIQIDVVKSERDKFETVLKEMTDGILIIDPNGSIELVNPAAERMFRIDEDFAKERSLASVLRNHKIENLWRQSQESGKYQVEMIELVNPNLHLQCISIPLGKSLPGNILLLFQDLTNIRRLETIRRDFISNISHELRTPLASLKALTETLQEGAMDDPEASKRFLSHIESEVDSLAQMVQELLELARIESGSVPVNMVRISVNNLFLPVLDRISIQTNRAGLDLILEIPEDIPSIMADPPRMEQVVSNLINNAIKFSPAGGKIIFSCVDKGDYVQFSIQDNGIGIPSSDINRIFERFYKTDRSRSGGGTGLGLAIARHLIEAHHGKIWVESEEGKGSIFYFTLMKEYQA